MAILPILKQISWKPFIMQYIFLKVSLCLSSAYAKNNMENSKMNARSRRSISNYSRNVPNYLGTLGILGFLGTCLDTSVGMFYLTLPFTVE